VAARIKKGGFLGKVINTPGPWYDPEHPRRKTDDEKEGEEKRISLWTGKEPTSSFKPSV